jgi:hypothetical protein
MTANFFPSVESPESSVIVGCTIVKAKNMHSISLLCTILASTDAIDWLEVFLVTWCVWCPEDRCFYCDGCCCSDPQRTIDRTSCSWRRMFSLVAQALSPAGSLCTATPVSRGCSLCNLLGEAIPRPSSHSCSRLGHFLVFSLGTPDGGDQHRTTGSEEGASSAPRCCQNADNCSIV